MVPREESLDAETVRHLKELGGDSFVERLVALLLEQAPQHVAAVADATRMGDMAAARRAAHTLRSTAGTVGALTLLAAAEQVETLVLEGADLDEVAAAAVALESEWARLKDRLV